MKEKLIKKLDGRTMTWFWKNHIKDKCRITYFTFMNQLEGRGKIRADVEKIIEDFLRKSAK